MVQKATKSSASLKMTYPLYRNYTEKLSLVRKKQKVHRNTNPIFMIFLPPMKGRFEGWHFKHYRVSVCLNSINSKKPCDCQITRFLFVGVLKF